MKRNARRFFCSLLFVVLYWGTAVPPVVADPEGRLGECIQSCKFLHELCMVNWFQYCLEFATYPGHCFGNHMPDCNRVTVDCKVTYCLGGAADSRLVGTRSEVSPGTERAVR